MERLVQIVAADRELVRIVDAAAAEAVRRSGSWIACRPGCTECCMGPFDITALDALRLQNGLRGLEAADPPRAAEIRRRASAYAATITPDYPGDSATGALDDPDRLPGGWDNVPCPALDPATGCCDLYAARPVTCRIFGPAMRTSEALGACELCYQGAGDEEIARCAVEIDPEGLESALLAGLDAQGAPRMTIVAFALARGTEFAPSGVQLK